MIKLPVVPTPVENLIYIYILYLHWSFKIELIYVSSPTKNEQNVKGAEDSNVLHSGLGGKSVDGRP